MKIMFNTDSRRVGRRSTRWCSAQACPHCQHMFGGYLSLTLWEWLAQ